MTVQIEKLGEARISPDGKSVKFTATGSKGEQLECIFPIDEIKTVTESLIALMASATVTKAAAAVGKETYGTKDENGWIEEPAAVLVSEFQAADSPDIGTFVLRLKDTQGRVVDVVFLPLHVPILKKMLAEIGPPTPAPGVH